MSIGGGGVAKGGGGTVSQTEDTPLLLLLLRCLLVFLLLLGADDQRQSQDKDSLKDGDELQKLRSARNVEHNDLCKYVDEMPCRNALYSGP